MPRGIPNKTKPTVDLIKVEQVASEHTPSQPVIEMATVELLDAPQAQRPKPDSELTPEQLRIRELEHQLALVGGKKDIPSEPDPDDQVGLGESDNILIHMLVDGFTAFGKVWYRGQEMEIVPDSQQYQDTRDRFGKSWLDLRNDEFAQADRWGEVMFRNGPWPGRTYRDGAKAKWSDPKRAPSEDDLDKAQLTEAKRRRAVPRLR